MDWNLVKQVSNKPQRDSKGRLLPGNTANPNGRPPKGHSITEVIKSMMDADPDLKTKIADKILRKIIEDGDTPMTKTLWNYIDGMPLQKNEIISDNPLFNLNVNTNRHTNGTSALPTQTNGSDKSAV